MNGELWKVSASDGSRIPVASPRSNNSVNGVGPRFGDVRRSSSMRLRGERSFALRLHGGTSPAFTLSQPPPDLLEQSGAAAHARPHILDNTAKQHPRPRTRSLSLSTNDDSPQCNYRASRNADVAPRKLGVPMSARSHSHLPAAQACTPDLDCYNELDCCDLDSVRSFASSSGVGGHGIAHCEHPHVAHNGTTFSGRRMRYVVHCSTHAGQVGDDYLTPTQRAQRQIRRLKHMLGQAKNDLDQKDSDIFRLTKEVVELRLYKASLNSPESSSEAITVRENATEDMKTPDSPTCTDFTDDPRSCNANMHSSCADSGHFEELGLGSTHSGDDARHVETSDKACLARLESPDEKRVVEEYERRLEELMRTHQDETHALRSAHSERIEELLQRLSDVNLRYCQLSPDLEQAREKIQELEKQLDEVNAQLQQYKDRKKQVNDNDQLMAVAAYTPSRVSVSDLLQQLQVTQTELENVRQEGDFAQAQTLLSAKEAVSLWVLGARKAMYRTLVESRSRNMDPEVTLQFLKSAIYYFLTDKENHQGHLRAIQSILGFTPAEISNIDKARYT